MKLPEEITSEDLQKILDKYVLFDICELLEVSDVPLEERGRLLAPTIFMLQKRSVTTYFGASMLQTEEEEQLHIEAHTGARAHLRNISFKEGQYKLTCFLSNKARGSYNLMDLIDNFPAQAIKSIKAEGNRKVIKIVIYFKRRSTGETLDKFFNLQIDGKIEKIVKTEM